MLDYSIIIPAYNEEALLPATLAAIAAARDGLPGEGEVIVVDNNSSDRTADVAAALGARVVFEAKNQIARARNAGAHAAQGELLIFIDADTLVDHALLVAAIERLRSGQHCACGAAIRFDADIPSKAARALRLFNRMASRFGVMAGSFVATSSAAFADVGGFPESVYAGEELFLSRRLQRWGKRHGRQTVSIIREHPVLTSARKFETYSLPHLIFSHLILGICPPLMRSKRFCSFWYSR